MGKNVLAIDLGASGGKAFLGGFDGKRITLDEIHRFENNPVKINGTLYWDILNLFHEIKQSILKAKRHGDFDSIGIDTWGVDFGFIAYNGHLTGNPVHYRDIRTEGMIDKSCLLTGGKEALYNATGTQIMEFNTIFQLFSIAQNNPEMFSQTESLLLIPDLFNYFLTGKKFAEISEASTTQLLNPYTMQWNYQLINMLNLPEHIFPKLVASGTPVGRLREDICAELDITPKNVISVASHDTASAVAGIPAQEEDFVYISCGTWSLLGTELETPIITKDSYKYNLTNEIGYNNKITFLKNISGLWLIQEARRQFHREGKMYSYNDMEQLARQCKPFSCFIDPDAKEFFVPGNIKNAIYEFCKKTNQYVPKTDGELIRCIYESLAMKYNTAFLQLKECTKKNYEKIYLAGGGAKDSFLCQMTADATGCDVLAGPNDVTALGNVIVQLIADKELKNLSEARKIAAESFSPALYKPNDKEVWHKFYPTFTRILQTV